MENQTPQKKRKRSCRMRSNVSFAEHRSDKYANEYYTTLQEIESVCGKFADLGYFVGKRIVCPCDFTPHEIQGRFVSSLKYEVCSGEIEVEANAVATKSQNLWDISAHKPVCLARIDASLPNALKSQEVFLEGSEISNFGYWFLRNRERCGWKSLSLSGLQTIRGYVGIDMLAVDYSQYDVAVTNPPFTGCQSLISLVKRAGCEVLMIVAESGVALALNSGLHISSKYAPTTYTRPDGLPKANVKTRWVSTSDLLEREIEAGLKIERPSFQETIERGWATKVQNIYVYDALRELPDENSVPKGTVLAVPLNAPGSYRLLLFTAAKKSTIPSLWKLFLTK